MSIDPPFCTTRPNILDRFPLQLWCLSRILPASREICWFAFWHSRYRYHGNSSSHDSRLSRDEQSDQSCAGNYVPGSPFSLLDCPSLSHIPQDNWHQWFCCYVSKLDWSIICSHGVATTCYARHALCARRRNAVLSSFQLC